MREAAVWAEWNRYAEAGMGTNRAVWLPEEVWRDVLGH